MVIWSICCLNTNLVLELLTELQRDGEEYQCVIEPGHNTLNLVNVADLKSVVVELTAKEHIQKISKFYDCFYLFPFLFYTTWNEAMLTTWLQDCATPSFQLAWNAWKIQQKHLCHLMYSVHVLYLKHWITSKDLSGVERQYMKLVHHQTQFAQVDVKVDHHISRHGGREHLLLEERRFHFDSTLFIWCLLQSKLSIGTSQKPSTCNGGRKNSLLTGRTLSRTRGRRWREAGGW